MVLALEGDQRECRRGVEGDVERVFINLFTASLV
jgi:hypothetical protein